MIVDTYLYIIQIYVYIHRTHVPYIHMGWLHVAGSSKLQVSFAKEPYKRDDILQKRPMILRRLLIVAIPYISIYLYARS